MFTAHDLFITAETDYRRERLMSLRSQRRARRVRHPRRRPGRSSRVVTGSPSVRAA